MSFLRSFTATALFGVLACVSSTSMGDVFPGVLSDFQDGTVQGWGGGTVVNVANSGPQGAGDHSLQLSNGGAGNFAMFNVGISGVVDPTIFRLDSDIFRAASAGAAEIRLVMFDTSSNRWTSTVAANVIDDGQWHRYSFSILEADLTRVVGSGTYATLVNNLERIMFRYDPGTPSTGGSALSGSMNFDNIRAIPEPASAVALLLGFAAVCGHRRRK